MFANPAEEGVGQQQNQTEQDIAPNHHIAGDLEAEFGLAEFRGAVDVHDQLVLARFDGRDEFGGLPGTLGPSLPVVDAETGALVDVYARADIGALARGGASSRLQWEDVTVGQALALALLPPATASASGHYGENPASQQRSSVPSPRPPRVYVCTAADSFRAVVERLACSSNNCSSSSSSPGVRRVFVVDPATRRVQAVVSLSDVAAYLFPGVAEAAAASKAGGRNA